MSFDAFVFDLGNTLVSYYTSRQFPDVMRESLAACADSCDISPNEIDTQELLEKAMSLNRERKDYAVWPLADRLETLFGAYRQGDLPIDAMSDAFLEPVFSRAVIDPDATKVLDELRVRGHKTAILSNAPWGSPADSWRRELQRHGLLQRCDAAIFCVDVGWRKPHPAPFRRVLELLDVSAERAAFIGDHPEWDVMGAEQSGLTPILLSPQPPDNVKCHVINELTGILDFA